MKARLVFVPPGGGETDYMLEFDLPGVPQPGDYVSVSRPGQQGTEDFVVRRSWWHLDYPEAATVRIDDNREVLGMLRVLVVECEFALAPESSENHKRASEAHRHNGRQPLKEFDNTAF